jgi:hypothetical protein
MKFNVEISLTQYELDFLVDYDWFQGDVNILDIDNYDKFTVQELINYHNILKIEVVDNGGFLNNHYLRLTQLGEKIFEQYK